MRLICFWCAVLATATRAQEDYYAPQTFRQVGSVGLFQPLHRPWNYRMQIPNRIDPYNKGLFTPTGRSDVAPQGSVASPWKPQQTQAHWKEPTPVFPRSEPWRAAYHMTKEQQAAILHHKQALTSEGSFRYEYASDNGLAAGEVIEPDGSRLGSYQYKDPNGQLVKLKYRAGKDGFQILEGSHLPKSPEPVQPSTQDNYYQQAYDQQRRQYDLQQQHNQQRPEPQQNWNQHQAQTYEGSQKAASGQYHVQSWRPQGEEDDGQYKQNEVEDRGPHSFGEGYAFSFQG